MPICTVSYVTWCQVLALSVNSHLVIKKDIIIGRNLMAAMS